MAHFRSYARLVRLAAAVLMLLYCVPAWADDAAPVALQGFSSERVYGLTGLENVGRIAPGVYRGAQPEGEGYATLKAMGMKTVINLRAFHGEKDAVEAAGMRSIEIPINIFRSVDTDKIEQAVAAMADPANQPVYVHCALGEDRTGTVVAVYRMTHQGWSYEMAIREMQHFGFNDIWTHLKKYLKEHAAILETE